MKRQRLDGTRRAVLSSAHPGSSVLLPFRCPILRVKSIQEAKESKPDRCFLLQVLRSRDFHWVVLSS